MTEFGQAPTEFAHFRELQLRLACGEVRVVSILHPALGVQRNRLEATAGMGRHPYFGVARRYRKLPNAVDIALIRDAAPGRVLVPEAYVFRSASEPPLRPGALFQHAAQPLKDCRVF